MATPKTITSANSKFTVTVPLFGLGPFTLEGYSADAAFAADTVDVAETRVGVDGKMSAAYVPFIVPITVTLEPNSESMTFFENWLGAQQAIREVGYAGAVIDIPSIGRSYICTKGALKRITPVPTAQKSLQPVVYAIDWESVQPVPLSGAV